MTSSPDWRLVADVRNELGEGPVWCPREQALWWIDVASPSLWRLDGATRRVQHWWLPKPPGSFALLDGDGLLIAFRSRLALLERPGGELRWLDLPAPGDERFNDGKVDRRGRFWVGTLDRALQRPLGCLYRVEGEGPSDLQVVDQGFPLSNGIAWSPDNSALYFAETLQERIYRYEFDLDSGRAWNRTVFAQAPRGGHPDGLTVDAEGGVWCVMFKGGCICRYRSDGSLDRTIPTPVSRPTSVMFGGPGLRTLFITTARHGLDAATLEREPQAGGVFALDVAQQGLVEPRMHALRQPA